MFNLSSGLIGIIHFWCTSPSHIITLPCSFRLMVRKSKATSYRYSMLEGHSPSSVLLSLLLLIHFLKGLADCQRDQYAISSSSWALFTQWPPKTTSPAMHLAKTFILSVPLPDTSSLSQCLLWRSDSLTSVVSSMTKYTELSKKLETRHIQFWMLHKTTHEHWGEVPKMREVKRSGRLGQIWHVHLIDGKAGRVPHLIDRPFTKWLAWFCSLKHSKAL